jgi:opacity protein-like surface antigen
MKTKTIALAGVFSVLATIPAVAGEGIYVGLGAGWDNQNDITVTQLAPPIATGQVSTNDGVLIAGSLGYKFPEIPIRIEFESGYDWHSVTQFQSGGTTVAANGHNNIASELFNAIYDIPIAPQWNISVGAGLGPGHVYFAPNLTSTGERFAGVDHWALMWQAIGGVSYELQPDIDIFVDYRYRDARARATFFSPTFGPVDSGPTTENVIMAGVRFYMFPGIEEPYPP